MHAQSVRLSSKCLYIADLARRLEAMESGRTAMSAVAYRLWARRMRVAMSGCSDALLAARLGRVHPSVADAIEERRFDADGTLVGDSDRRARRAAAALLRRLTGHAR